MNDLYSNTSVSPELEARLRAMPKIELHVHLEGATDAATTWELAQRNHIDLPASSQEAWRAQYAFRDFAHFIQIYELAAGCIREPEDFAFMTERFLARQAEQQVRYCEVFLSTSLFLGRLPTGEVIAALAEGLRQGEAQHGVRCRFIPDVARQQPDTRFGVLDFVLEGHAAGIFLGLGLGGVEQGFPSENYQDVFDEARRQGLRVVAHAGETDGPQSIWGALRALKAERIGHGIASVQDPALIDHLAETRVPVEVSPHSNYRLRLVPADQPHPIRRMKNGGLVLTVNTDDPPYFSTDLASEYLLLARQGFTWEELWEMNLNALESSFLPEVERAIYRAEWVAFAAKNG